MWTRRLFAQGLGASFVSIHQAGFGPSPPPARPDPVIARPLGSRMPIVIVAGDGLAELHAGFELIARRRVFGGLSALRLEGSRLFAASDRGLFWAATVERDRTGRLRRLTDWSGHPVLLPGRRRRTVLDIEAMTRLQSGNLLLALEQRHELLELDGSTLAPVQASRLPGLLGSAPRNQGVEALTTLPDGRLVAITEGQASRDEGLAAAVIGPRDWRPFSYVPRPGFRPTGATRSGERVFVLERSASLLGGLRAVIIELDARVLQDRPRVVRAERVIARIDANPIGANFEGISAEAAPDGGTFLYLVSDDNFSGLLSTLLLQLKLAPSRPWR
jgi:hypothetical protein